MTYGLDKAYVLMNDIPLDSQNMWQLPQDFTGAFSSADGKTADETSALYDAQADTIYIYHPYQLMLMAMQGEDVSEQPVMSEDYDAAHFGMGQMIYPNGEENGNLTYSRTTNTAYPDISAQKCPKCWLLRFKSRPRFQMTN